MWKCSHSTETLRGKIARLSFGETPFGGNRNVPGINKRNDFCLEGKGEKDRGEGRESNARAETIKGVVTGEPTKDHSPGTKI